MDSVRETPLPDDSDGKVLLVGDIRDVVLDADAVDAYGCVVQDNVLNAIEAVAKGRYEVVAVVMSGLSGRLVPALEGLRRSTKARIILLAQMYEEPVARRIVDEKGAPGKVADGYLICPTTLANLCRCVPVGGRVATAGAGDVSVLAAKIRNLEWLATTDDLTGLKNRRYIREFARQILERAEQNAGRVTLLLFDIDNFKHYNDQYGHLTGDEILKQAALLMRRSCRPHDVVGRVGGDEFAVVFWDDPHTRATEDRRDRRSTDAEHPTEAIFVAKRFQKEFGNAELTLLGPEGRGVLTISGGLASFPRDGSTVQELFERADSALLDAKRQGKNRIYLVGEPQNDIAKM